MAEINQNNHMIGGQPHSMLAISFAELKLRVFQKVQPGVLLTGSDVIRRHFTPPVVVITRHPCLIANSDSEIPIIKSAAMLVVALITSMNICLCTQTCLPLTKPYVK